MDKYEVTNAQYKKFVDAHPDWEFVYLPPWNGWNGRNYPSGRATYPVTVPWWHAMRYAKWVGKRLPTEAEWEKAARGGLVGKRYPWGNVKDDSKPHLSYSKRIGPVGTYPPNGYGLCDMVGNGMEWCLDEHDNEFYSRSPYRNPVSGSSIKSRFMLRNRAKNP